MEDSTFDRAFEAAKKATAELDALCERYGVPYIEYSRVYDAIMGICEEVGTCPTR